MVQLKGIQAKSADTSIIENRLRNTEPGDVVTYDELSKLLGRNVRTFCLGYVATARKSLVAESIFFDTLSNEGYKRLDSEEACHASKHYVRRVKSAARRGMVHLQHVPFDGLSDDGKRTHLTASAQLGAVALFAGASAEKKIGSNVEPGKPLAIGATLKLFGG